MVRSLARPRGGIGAARPLADTGIFLPRTAPGEHRTACPMCAKPCRDDALAVRIEPDGAAVWCCHRCGWAGTTRARERVPWRARPPARVIPPAEPPTRPAGLPGPAAGLWRGSLPVVPGTLAAAYLEHRVCALPHPEGHLRWHPRLRHPTGHVGPGLVALLTDAVTGRAMSLHRTWLAADGRGKAAVEGPRRWWPRLPKAGGVVRLWPDPELTTGLCVAEGLESALSAALGFGLAWATADAGNLENLPVLDGIECLTIVADHDELNPKTGERRGLEAAHHCARRWREAGKEARLWRSPIEGTDLNDFARGEVA